MQNEQEESKGLNILCIDGGGVRGISSLIILQEIMRRVSNAKGSAEAQSHEHFDVIAGTGTGGRVNAASRLVSAYPLVVTVCSISACMLGRLRMPVDKAIAEYAKLVKEVCKEKKMSGPTMYKGTKLQEALNTMIREATGDEGERMIDNQKGSECRTVVFAMAKHSLNASLPVMFWSYSVATNPGPDCTIREALYATMAHPDLFKPINIVDSYVSQSLVGGEHHENVCILPDSSGARE